MLTKRSLGRQFEWFWLAYAVSTFGSYIALDAFPLIAILVLHAGPGKVSMLAAAGTAVGAALAIPLGAWGLLASLTGLRAAIAIAGILLLATPFLLPRPAVARKPVPRPSAMDVVAR